MHAHPDDESLTTGGTMARYVAEGARVALVTCTLGEQGEVIPPELAQLDADAADQLGGYRSGELAAALRELGVSEHHYLGGIGRWRDSGMAGTPSAAHPRAFVQGTLVEQTRQLAGIMAEFDPQVVVTYDAHGGYGHPDHVRAHEITMAAADQATTVWRVFHTVMPEGELARGVAGLPAEENMPFTRPEPGELPSVPDARVSTTIDTAAYRDAKTAALRAHRTQVSVPSRATGAECAEYYALSNGVAQPIPSAEHFVLARGDPAGSDADLFGGWGE